MSSAGQLARNRSISMSSGRSARGIMPTLAEISQSMPAEITRDFEPCAATASMFLYAQGSSVVCCHHDTLTIERRFSRHTEDITLLAVDAVSDRGAGRLVVSYDRGQTAIVWDCMTGDEIARFASYENLTVAAWMRNGNVAFGNAQGNVILFEPATSEHISARTIDQIPITALAPSADCRTYAIGFSNGSLLIAALQPRFTILHNLSTSRGPSPIVTLAWHASSSRQKSDMLATQTNDGDLRVWSIAKSPTSSDTAKVVRVLKRSENFRAGPNWLAWSKNGRIIQYSESETSSWDVRTKHVTFDPIPTLENVRGLAVYGPGASLFTLGPNNTAQQFDLNIPAQLVANVQHPANLLPPSPPVSIEEQRKQKSSGAMQHADMSAMPINIEISESDEDHMSPLAKIAREMDRREMESEEPDRSGNLSPVSSRSRTSTTSRSSAGSRTHHRKPAPKAPISVASHGMSDIATTMSMGSIMQSREPSIASRDSFSMSSVTSSHVSRGSRRGGSRLRQEILHSPEEQKLVDLFKFTRARLSDIPYHHPRVVDNTRLTVDNLRRQMLQTIFGWNGEADTLIQDEINRYPQGSPQRLLLAKWLGDIDTDIMATSSDSMTSSDWMILALSGISGTASQAKVARAYVQRLLEKGDVHTAATILIGMGDQNDAIEIYVSHKRYMEAVILTCLVFPADWSRQAELVKKWGGWAVQHSQQQLAIRCFSCTESESTEPWFSPSAQALTFASQMGQQSIPELLSPPLSPPGNSRGPQRSIAKTSALKLITSFGDKSGKAKFFGLDDDRTPVGGGVTPIAESALSPQGDTTAFLRPSNRSVYNTPASARTATPGGFSRQRLPSIGEMPNDVVIPRRHMEPTKLPTPADSGSDREKEIAQARAGNVSQPGGSLQLNSATYNPIARSFTASPMMEKTKYKLQPLPSPSPESFNRLKQTAQGSRHRNGSRDRKPDGLQIHWPPMESIITGDYMTSPDPSVASSRATTTSRSVAASVASSTRSPVMSERSYRSGAGAASPVVTGRSIDEYISSLDSAQHYKKETRARHESRDRHGRARSSSRKPKAREASEDRSRANTRYIKPAKRSPTSPVPMSPEDLIDLKSDNDVPFSPAESTITNTTTQSRYPRESSRSRAKSSRNTSRVRRASPEPTPRTQSRATSRAPSRNASRQPSPGPGRLAMIDTRSRGRSHGREGSAIRSPSSPLPMSPQARFYQDEDEEDLRRAHEDQMRFRETRSRHRSGSRMRDRSTARQESPERKQRRDRSTSRRPTERSVSRARNESSPPTKDNQRSHVRSTSQVSHARLASDRDAGDVNLVKDARTLKKEQAARELEERRKSLALRPMAPPIVHPEEIATLSPVTYRQQTPDLSRSLSRASQQPPRSQTTSPAYQKDSTGSSVQVGLPATPKAMKHPKYDPDGDTIPDVPSIPEKYDSGSGSGSSPGSNWGSLNAISYNSSFETLGPLPKTTYSAAPRRVPARCASAPIPEEAPHSPNPLPAALPMHPAFQAALPPSTRRQQSAQRSTDIPSPRKINPGESQPGTLGYEARNNSPVYSSRTRGIDELVSKAQPTNPNDNLVPPPPPPAPAPPILSQLQHLAMPPPPPPAPLFNPNNTQSMVSGVSTGSGDIEIVMDDEIPLNPSPTTAASPLSPPQPPFAGGHARKSSLGGNVGSGHSRGRSESNNSISGRFKRGAERLRSASRGRNSPSLGGAKSPPIEQQGRIESPYDSNASWNQGRRPSVSSPTLNQGGNTERHPREVKAAMKKMEGGMI